MNSTTSSDNAITDPTVYYIVCSLSGGFCITSIIISLIIIIIVRRSKPRLHTVRHLLMCNTCTASMFYCIVQTINYIFLIFLPWITSDIACRWRGYFGYVSISAATYSYLVQSISRLFFSVFSAKYPVLTRFKAHYVLISIHWLTVLVITLPAIVTNDIYFRPGLLCWVPFKKTIHMAYTGVGYYIVPVMSIGIIYVCIYRRIKRARNSTMISQAATNDKRDLEVLRNIVILLCIYIMGGVPTLIFLMSSVDAFYFTGIVAFTFAVAVEKICTILLDRELRQVVKGIIFSRNRVMAFENTMSLTKQPNK